MSAFGGGAHPKYLPTLPGWVGTFTCGKHLPKPPGEPHGEERRAGFR